MSPTPHRRWHIAALRAALRAVLLLGGVSLVTFVVLDWAPGDFLSEARLAPGFSEARVAAERTRLEMDGPLIARYSRWLGSLTRGEGGRSFAYGVPVLDLLRARAPTTVWLVAAALVVSWSAAIAMGIWTVVRRHHWDGRALATGVSVCMGVPDLVLVLALLVLAGQLQWLTPIQTGAPGPGVERAAGLVTRLWLPVVALSASQWPMLQRHVRAGLLAVLDEPFVAAARARGVPPRRLVWRSALRVAAAPLVSLFGLSVATTFSASMVVEVVMSLPGLGPLFLEAVLARDQPVVLAGVMTMTLLLVIGSVASDALLPIADPRVAKG